MEDTAIVFIDCHSSIQLTPLFESGANRPHDGQVETRVEVDSGVFRGAFPIMLTLHDLNWVRTRLQEIYDHVGETTERSLHFWDGEISMTFHPTVLGQFQIDVRATPYLSVGPFLQFEMQTDQSYLPSWIASVEAVIRAWPGPDDTAERRESG